MATLHLFQRFAARLHILMLAAFLSLAAHHAVLADITRVQSDNKAMIRAIEDAQSTLDRMLAKTSSQNGTVSQHVMMKVAMPTRGGSIEHIWVENIKVGGRIWRGRFANQPLDFQGRLGGPARFTSDQVSDWTFEHKGRLYGGYTMRVLLDFQSKEDAKATRAVLTKRPMPANW